MFVDLTMLMDIFIQRQPLHSVFVIKTHPRQLPAVQLFIDQYTKAHPSVGIVVKGTPYLVKGEYEVHVQPSEVMGGATAALRDKVRAAA